jgi:hypothetical protein
MWKTAGTEYRLEGSTPSGKDILVTGHGNPAQSGVNNFHKISPYMTRAMFVPALAGSILRQELEDQNYSIRYDGTGNIGSASVLIVTTGAETKYPDNVVTPQVWYFDSATGYPLRVEFRSPDSRRPANFLPVAYDLSDFRMVAGVMYPFQVAFSINGQPVQAFSITSIQVNAIVSPSDFDAPSGGAL